MMTLFGSRCIFVPVQSTDIITAAPNQLSRAFWGRYFEWTLRRSFHRVVVRGEEQLAPWSNRADALRESIASEPLIIYASHASWWDAALAIVLSERIARVESFGMMEHRQLARYRFFRGIGMFSVIREDPRSALRSLQYAADLLLGTTRVLWMFPQGTLIHQDVRPLGCEPGVGVLASKLPAVWMCPVAMRYELLREQRPQAWIEIGEPYRVEGGEPRILTVHAEERLTAVADQLRVAAMHEREEGFRAMTTGPRSMEKRFDTLLGRRTSERR